jgi:phage I-like protein
MAGLFPKPADMAPPPSPLEQTAEDVAAGRVRVQPASVSTGFKKMDEELEKIINTAKTSKEIRQMVKNFLKGGTSPDEVFLSSFIGNMIDALSESRTEKELLEDMRGVLRTTQAEVRKMIPPQGGRRRRKTQKRRKQRV